MEDYKTEGSDPIDLISYPSTGAIINPGLTKREYFSSSFYAGMLANPNLNLSSDQMARFSLIYADEFIETLNKPKEELRKSWT